MVSLKAGSQYDISACVVLFTLRCVVFFWFTILRHCSGATSREHASSSFGDPSAEWRAIATAKISCS